MENQFLMDVGIVSETLVIFFFFNLVLGARIFLFLKDFLQSTFLDGIFFCMYIIL